jgi:hypothetical protein
MDKEELLDIKNSILVKSLLNDLKENRIKVRLWQHSQGRREHVYAYLEEVDPINRRLRFHIVEGEIENFSTKNGLFFHSNYRDILFKSELISLEEAFIEICFPIQVKMVDGRCEKREVYGVNGYQYARVTFLNQKKEKIDAKINILDSSQNGLAVMVSTLMNKDLRVNDRIVVHEISVCKECKDSRVYIIRNKSAIDNFIGAAKFYRLGLELYSKESNTSI